jgi:molecular chaperone GrpE (heat shock protein)
MEEINQLEELFTKNLSEVNYLKNRVEQKEQEKHDLFKEIALGIIEVLDSYYRVEEGLLEKEVDKTEDGAKAIKRYATIAKKLLALLQRHGVTQLEFPESRLIVGYSKVVDTEHDANKKNDDIISIVKNGYIRGKELIREAEVIVVTN